jgi:hypothetical protein
MDQFTTQAVSAPTIKLPMLPAGGSASATGIRTLENANKMNRRPTVSFLCSVITGALSALGYSALVPVEQMCRAGKLFCASFSWLLLRSAFSSELPH